MIGGTLTDERARALTKLSDRNFYDRINFYVQRLNMIGGTLADERARAALSQMSARER
jgi:hypothetical protein